MSLFREQLTKLKAIGKKYQILFAYLFGSQAKGIIGKLSDIDIAFYFDEKLNSGRRFDRKLRLIAELSEIFKTNNIDIVLLNDVYPLLGHRIIRDGKVLFSFDERKRKDFEVKTMSLYFDFKPYLEKYTKATFQ